MPLQPITPNCTFSLAETRLRWLAKSSKGANEKSPEPVNTEAERMKSLREVCIGLVRFYYAKAGEKKNLMYYFHAESQSILSLRLCRSGVPSLCASAWELFFYLPDMILLNQRWVFGC